MILSNDKILTINDDGSLELKSYDISNHFDDNMILIEKYDPKKHISAVYFDGNKENFLFKKILIENSTKIYFY